MSTLLIAGSTGLKLTSMYVKDLRLKLQCRYNVQAQFLYTFSNSVFKAGGLNSMHKVSFNNLNI